MDYIVLFKYLTRKLVLGDDCFAQYHLVIAGLDQTIHFIDREL